MARPKHQKKIRQALKELFERDPKFKFMRIERYDDTQSYWDKEQGETRILVTFCIKRVNKRPKRGEYKK